MKILFATLADYSASGERGKLNIMGIFDRIGSTDFPACHQKLHIVSRVKVDSMDDPGKAHDLTLRLESPEGKTLNSMSLQIPVRQQTKVGQILNINCNLCNQVFPEPGPYRFHVTVDESSFTLDLEITHVEPGKEHGPKES